MSEEIKIEEEKKCNCFCHSKGFRKFLIVATGTFVGAFLALSLFAALHKPPMPVPMPCPCHHRMMAPCPCHHMDRFDRGPGFDRGPRGEFHKKFNKENFERKLPPRAENRAPIEVDD